MPLHRPLLFAVSFFVIFVLGLLIGGDRLWTTDQDQIDPTVCATEKAEARLPDFFAFFCDPIRSQNDRTASLRDDARQSAGQVREPVAHRPIEARLADVWPARDANGNVLQQSRYMQAVYFAFALGDVSG
ncbi:MAG: hypothetical protein FWD25_11030 [Clostridia bacterium]|nr:hypothetical protein [Clostridia bacterium]